MISRTLIASDGSVLGLLAAASERRERGPGQLLCITIGAEPIPATEVDAAGNAQAELFEHRFVPRRDLGIVRGSGAASSRPGERITRELLELGFLALHEGVGQLIWAGGGGDDPASIAVHLGRALLVERLVGLERSPEAEPLRIQVPYADLTDRQAADLVLDMDLPLWACWWWALARGPRNAPGAEAARLEYQRWEAVLKEAGWRDGIPGPEVVTRPIEPGATAATPPGTAR